MLKIENVNAFGFEAAIRGMRNSWSSWDKSDSYWNFPEGYAIGKEDMKLCSKLIKTGPEHRKFLRFIHIQMDITAPMHFLMEFDTYKISTNSNGTSKMHKLLAKPFELSDFSAVNPKETREYWVRTIDFLNTLRDKYILTHDFNYWRQILDLLPCSYNQTRTWDGSMETILSMLKQRKGHKLEEWSAFRQECFEKIPYCLTFYDSFTNNEKVSENM